MEYAKILSTELNVPEQYAAAAIALIDEGNTIPFIARYRKEATNAMDDQVLRTLAERLDYLRGLEKRKGEVAAVITEQGAMTEELERALAAAKTLAEVEDLYRPYKPKRKTRASVAKARGLEPLAQALRAQDARLDVQAEAEKYITEEVPDAETALAGARDILAEQVSDDAALRAELRKFYRAFGLVKSKAAKEEDSVYAQYYDFLEPVNRIAGHRVLARVAGLSASTAKNVVAWREENGAFASRTQLKKVKGLGPKAFEQCAGFLRLPGAKNALDGTAVHPESYPAAEKLLELCGFAAKDIGTDAIAALPQKAKEMGFARLCAETGAGEPTLKDIIAELLRPGRDMRDELPPPLLRTDVMGMEDLKPGMELTGTVRNVIDFGAFVDIGVHQDGLVHVSQLSDRFIKHPSQAVKVGDVVKVKVLDVDLKKKRIALTMKGLNQ